MLIIELLLIVNASNDFKFSTTGITCWDTLRKLLDISIRNVTWLRFSSARIVFLQ